MTPGRELDIAIGRHVMGDKGIGVLIPDYSTRIESAMRVVEHLGPSVYWHITRSPIEGWIVSLDCTEPFVRTTPGAEADTASHAICLAALKAVDTEVPS